MHGGERNPTAARADVSWPPLDYRPALDGLRGLAVLAVVLYHAGFAPGGFLGVSTFFTLSGFLITYLLVAERGRTGRIALASFYLRRARRLLPAALVALGLIALATTLAGSPGERARLGPDIVSALGYITNWRFVATGDEYGALFTAPSPLQHFWSLAVEEQLYVVVPLLLVGLAALGRGRRRVMAVGIGAAALASVLTGVVLSVVAARGDGSLDRLYFGTDVRAAELLAGSLLALTYGPRLVGGQRRASKVSQFVGPVALGACAVCWFVGEQRWVGWYRGGLVAYSVATCAVIVAAMHGPGVVTRVAQWRPLVRLGVISYGVYLFHAPVFTFVGPRGERSLAWFGPRVAITIALATLSYALVETPIRLMRYRNLKLRVVAPPVAAGIVAVTMMALALPAGTVVRPSAIDYADALAAFQRQAPAAEVTAVPTPAPVPTSTAPDVTSPPPPPMVAFFGDSTALMTGLGFARWAQANPNVVTSRPGSVQLGCGVVPGVVRRLQGRLVPAPEECDEWLARWRQAIQDSRPDIAVVQFGPWEVADQRLPGATTARALGDPVLDAAVEAGLRQGLAVLAEAERTVVLLIAPTPESDALGRNDGARMARFNDIQRAVAQSTPRVALVDLAAYVSAHPDVAVRPDGVHFTESSAARVAEWLGPALVEAARGAAVN